MKSKIVVILNLFLFLSLNTSAFGGVDLDGTDGFVDIGTMGNFGTDLDTSHFIFSCWFNSSNTTQIMTLCGTTNDGSNTAIQVLLNTQNGSTVNAHDIRLFRRDEDAQARGFYFTYTDGVCDGNWHHIAVSMDDDSGYVAYLDGVTKVGTATNSDIPDNMANFQYAMYIGATNNRGVTVNPFDGEITDVSFFSKAGILTIAQANELFTPRLKYVSINVSISSNLESYLPLNDLPEGTNINTATFKDRKGTNDGTGSDAGGESITKGEEILSYPPQVQGWQ